MSGAHAAGGAAARYREAGVGDLAALAVLEREVFGDEAYPAFFFRQALDLWAPFFLIAEDEAGRLAGYALAAPSARGGEACVLSTGVHPDCQGQGIATRLIEALLGRLGEAGIGTVWLTVHPENAGAVGLYRRLGFEAVGKEADYFGPGEPRLRMERRAGEGGAGAEVEPRRADRAERGAARRILRECTSPSHPTPASRHDAAR